MKKYLLYSIIMILALSGCGEKRRIAKARLQAQCPEVFVLNYADNLSVQAAGVEQTDQYLYQVSFAQLSNECIVKKKKTRLHFSVVLQFEGDAESGVPYPPFEIFASFLDKDKKVILREKAIYHPSDWKRLNKLQVKNQLSFYYPTDITPPDYVYFGFVQNKEALQSNYQLQNQQDN